MAHAAIEASGYPAATSNAIDCLAHGGRIVLVGWNTGPITVDTVQIMRKEATVYGSRNSSAQFPRALEILSAGHIDIERMITHRVTLTEAQKGMEIMSDRTEGALKVVLTS